MRKILLRVVVPHCGPTKEIEKNFYKPIRTITAEDFDIYPPKALTTWGEVDDFKYFLPRLLELNVYGENDPSEWPHYDPLKWLRL